MSDNLRVKRGLVVVTSTEPPVASRRASPPLKTHRAGWVAASQTMRTRSWPRATARGSRPGTRGATRSRSGAAVAGAVDRNSPRVRPSFRTRRAAVLAVSFLAAAAAATHLLRHHYAGKRKTA